MVSNFLQQPLFAEIILPFVLIFTLVFAILEKSKLLGEDKHQINAIIGLVIAAIFTAVGKYAGWIQQFMVFLVITVVILFVFMLIFAFFSGNTNGNPIPDNYKTWLGIVAVVAVVVATLIITGFWDTLWDWVTADNRGANIALILIVVAAVWAVLGMGKKSGGKE